jgi:peptidoglycan/xylan/chitin deacetylase (PgdA/CDA1 family)
MTVVPAFSQDATFHFFPRYAAYLRNTDMQLKGSFYYKANTDRKIVALTFDDGPSAHTERLTALLKRKECPAAFFLVGQMMTGNRNRLQFYNDSLFEVGAHSYFHFNSNGAANANTIKNDFQRSMNAFSSLMPDHTVKYYRPPYGIVHRNVIDQMEAHNLQGVLWSFDTMDYLRPRPTRQKAINDINSHLSNGDIILAHEGINLNLLEEMIDTIRNNGFTIVKLSELMEYPNIIPF